MTSENEFLQLPIIEVNRHNWMSANGSHRHWQTIHAARLALRNIAALRFRGVRVPEQWDYPLHVTALIGYPTRGRVDPDNAAPTVKPIIDGLVDAGVIADDSDKYLAARTYMRDRHARVGRGTHSVRLILEPYRGGHSWQ